MFDGWRTSRWWASLWWPDPGGCRGIGRRADVSSRKHDESLYCLGQYCDLLRCQNNKFTGNAVMLMQLAAMLCGMRQAECLQPYKYGCKAKPESSLRMPRKHESELYNVTLFRQAAWATKRTDLLLRSNRPLLDLVELAPDTIIAVPFAFGCTFGILRSAGFEEVRVLHPVQNFRQPR